MPTPPLQQTLDKLIAGWEGECVEFKEANDNYPTSDISNRTPTRYRHRAFDDAYYCDLILEYLKTFGQGRRPDFERLLAGKLPMC
jgi:hypothetical protein